MERFKKSAYEKEQSSKAKSQWKHNMKRFPKEMMEAGDNLIRAFIAGNSPNWGGMKIQGIQLS